MLQNYGYDLHNSHIRLIEYQCMKKKQLLMAETRAFIIKVILR